MVLPEPAKDEDEARIWFRVWRVLGRVGGGPAWWWCSAAEEPARIICGEDDETPLHEVFCDNVYCKSLKVLIIYFAAAFRSK